VFVDANFDSFLRELESNIWYSWERKVLNMKVEEAEAPMNSARTAKDIMEVRVTNLAGLVKDAIADLADTFDEVLASLRHELELISNLVLKREAPPSDDWEVVPEVKRPRRIASCLRY
jgi:hypothetical protein